jgi:hypothetical protein
MLLAFLVLLRAPSLVQPAGGDQGLYLYEGQRVLHGDVMYRDVWDQKPPAIAFVYAGLWRIWPHESVVPIADLAAAVIVAALLVVLGRRTFGGNVGFVAASIFLMFGNPAFQRLDGVRVRAQCETFISIFVTLALVLLASRRRSITRAVLAGVCLGAATLLKYNAALYLLPAAVAIYVWTDEDDAPPPLWRDMALVAGAWLLTLGVVFGYFAARGALRDLTLATVTYNIDYSATAFQGVVSIPVTVVKMLWQHVRADWLWFLGAIGAGLLLLRWRFRLIGVPIVWLVAAALSIAVNGRGLPQYFVQAAPALAFAAAAGLAGVGAPTRFVRVALVFVLLAGIWRVGDEPTSWTTPRLADLSGMLSNMRFDLLHMRGHMDRESYLSKFQQPDDKYLPLAEERLATLMRETTPAAESVYVFGFSSGAAYVKSDRRSSSRFFWSRPVVIEFARDVPGYGSAGLLADLRRDPPSIVALQKHDWGILAERQEGAQVEQDSAAFFLHTAPLRDWLETGYKLEQDTPEFSVWRRRS